MNNLNSCYSFTMFNHSVSYCKAPSLCLLINKGGGGAIVPTTQSRYMSVACTTQDFTGTLNMGKVPPGDACILKSWDLKAALWGSSTDI